MKEEKTPTYKKYCGDKSYHNKTRFIKVEGFCTAMETLLAELGLTPLERAIYGMLLEHGSAGASTISQKTGIHRRNVYDCIERLIQKGLVGYIKENNRNVYSITNPETILHKLQQRERSFAALLPDLLHQYRAGTEKKETLFFRGKAGLKLIFEDQIREGKEVLVNATTTKVDQVLTHFFPKYQLLRKEHIIPTRMLFDAKHATLQNRKELAQLPLAKVRFIKEFNKSPMSQYLYGNNVAIVVWSNTPIAILIRQHAIAQGFRQNFEVLWRMAETRKQQS